MGRPFATHRDSVSELVGEVVEVAVKNVLTEAKVSFRETKRAERIAGFALQHFSYPNLSCLSVPILPDSGGNCATRHSGHLHQRLSSLRRGCHDPRLFRCPP